MGTRKTVVWILNGPNLNWLGRREPHIYGQQGWPAIEARLYTLAEQLGVELVCRQSNHEGQLIDWLQEAASGDSTAGVVLNAAGFTHTSVALRDCVASLPVPVVEVHLSNIHAREPFRHHSLLAPVAAGQIVGFGPLSYELGLRAVVSLSEQATGSGSDRTGRGE